MKNRAVLFVDDEEHILRSIKRGLLDEEYKKLFANSAKEALEIMKKEKVSVLITDMKMPEMDGLSFLKIVKESYPDTIKIVLSGFTQLPQILATINQVDIFKFITKPWSLEDELKPIIQQAIEFYDYKIESKRLQDELERKNILYKKVLRETDKKLIQVKTDYMNIKKLSSSCLNLVKKYAVMFKDDKIDTHNFIGRIDSLENLFSQFINTVPTNNIKFNLEKLQNDIYKYMSNELGMQDLNIELVSDDEKKYVCYGNYNLLSFILTSILSYILNFKNYNLSKFIITSKSDEISNMVNIYFLLQVQEDFVDDDDLLLSLNQICEFTGGNISTTKKDNKIAFLIKTGFEKTQ